MTNRKAGNRPVDILLVEDSPSDAHLMTEVFGETQFLKHLHVVKDGVEALNFLYRQGKYEHAPRPALILLDLNLPKLDGSELLAAIKTDPNLQLIPVVVLTTSATPADVLKSYKLHANSYIVKPLDLDDFIEVVEAIVHFWLGVATLPADALGTAC